MEMESGSRAEGLVSVYVSSELWMCSGNGGSSVEVEKKRRKRRRE
jgi:hypothetical protein